MNLKTVSIVYSHKFMDKVISIMSKGQQPRGDGLSFSGEWKNSNIEHLDTLFRLQHDVALGELGLRVVHDPDAQGIVDGGAFDIMAAAVYAGREYYPTPSAAYKNFVNTVRRVEDTRLRESELYTQVLFEYLWIAFEWTFKQTRFHIPGIVESMVQGYKDAGKSAKECWLALNYSAGFDIEEHEANQYTHDPIFAYYWGEDLE